MEGDYLQCTHESRSRDDGMKDEEVITSEFCHAVDKVVSHEDFHFVNNIIIVPSGIGFQ
jgi:hypothetical protein